MNQAMHHRVVLCLGSNKDSERALSEAQRQIAAYMDRVFFSTVLLTDPDGEVAMPGLFRNQVVIAYTSRTYEEVLPALKEMERLQGRRPEDKLLGSIPIDIDLLMWDETVLKPKDWQKGYVQQLYQSLLVASAETFH